MKFREFDNPEEKDYDITSSLRAEEKQTNNNIYVNELLDLIGILEDVSEEDLQREYGISIHEYYYPTAETIQKVTEKLNSHESNKIKH